MSMQRAFPPQGKELYVARFHRQNWRFVSLPIFVVQEQKTHKVLLIKTFSFYRVTTYYDTLSSKMAFVSLPVFLIKIKTHKKSYLLKVSHFDITHCRQNSCFVILPVFLV